MIRCQLEPKTSNQQTYFQFSATKKRFRTNKERVKSLTTLSGYTSILETSEYDFIDVDYYSLAKITVATFPDDSPINNQYIFILDERSLRDQTCVLLQIPLQILETDINDVGVRYITKQERKFHRREEYVLHRNGWIDRETGEDVGVQELKAVRVKFEDMGLAYKLNALEESVGELARFTYNTNGVFMSGPEYQYPDQRLDLPVTGAKPFE